MRFFASAPAGEQHNAIDTLRLGMFDDVVQRLLGDPVEGYVNIFRQIGHWVALQRHCDRDAAAAGDRLGQLPQQVAEVRLYQRGRPQLQEQSAHLGQRAAGELAQLAQELPAFSRVVLPEPGAARRQSSWRKTRFE